MASVVFTDARVFYAGYEFTSQHNRVELSYGVESLDNTVFGSTTRTRTGGLKTGRATTAGFWEGGVGNIDQVLFDSMALDDAVVLLFPQGITEG